MKTTYTRVTFRSLTTIAGKTTRTLGTQAGRTLTRVTADGRDDLVVEQQGRVEWEVPWSNIASAEPAHAPVVKAPKVRKTEAAP